MEEEEEVKDLKEILGPHSIEVKKAGRPLSGRPLSERLKRFKDWPSAEADACIYRVHDGLRTAETEAHYKPLLVSIGPYHHGDKKLRALMQEHKLRYLNSFLERTGKRLEDCMSIVEGCANSALACYAGPIKMTWNEFVEMMLLDSCFIIEFLYRLAGKDGTANDARKSDPIFKVDWMLDQVVRDFHLLENQVPFGFPFQHLCGPQLSRDLLERAERLVTCELLNFKLPRSQPQPHHFLDSAKNFTGKIFEHCSPRAHDDYRNDDFEGQQRDPGDVEYKHFLYLWTKSCVPSKKKKDEEDEKKKEEEEEEEQRKEGQQRDPGNVEYKHFLDLVTKICVPSKKEEKKDAKEEKAGTLEMPCVKELRQGSIAFEVNESDGVTLFDIEFDSKYRWPRRARLRMPRLTVDDNTETVFRNIIAYEQHNLEAKFRYFTDYTHFLDELINSGEDVTYLRLQKIINNMLGDDDEVASLINRLGHGRIIDSDTYYYSRVCEQVNDHYERTWNQTMATLRRKFFYSPWARVSTLAGLLLLVLTTTSTVVSLIKAIT